MVETIHRILAHRDGLLWPYPVHVTDPDPDEESDSAQIATLHGAIGRLSEHFRSCGLTPVESAPWVGQISTTFTALAAARACLGAVRKNTALTLGGVPDHVRTTATGRIAELHVPVRSCQFSVISGHFRSSDLGGSEWMRIACRCSLHWT